MNSIGQANQQSIVDHEHGKTTILISFLYLMKLFLKSVLRNIELSSSFRFSSNFIRSMSQFIQLPKTMPLQAPALLKGILSKVVGPSSSDKQFFKTNSFDKQFTQSYSQAFFKTKTDKRFVEQMKIADNLQHIVINKEYQTMKKNLNKYGRSKSSKIMNIVKERRPSSYFDQQPQKQAQFKRFSKNGQQLFRPSIDILAIIKMEEKQAKLRYSVGNIYSSKDSHDRVVFVDRKYNKQFAIKRSSLIESQQIQSDKQTYVKFLSKYKKKEPLVEEAKIKRVKYYSQYEKQPIQSIGIFRELKDSQKLYKPKNRRKSCEGVSEISHHFSGRKKSLHESFGKMQHKEGLNLNGNIKLTEKDKKSQLSKKNKILIARKRQSPSVPLLLCSQTKNLQSQFQ